MGSRSAPSTPRREAPSPTRNWRRRSVVARRNGLGRGLSSLIPSEAAVTEIESPDDRGAVFVELPVTSIVANRHQPRQVFDDEALTALTASVREVGVLQPVLVRVVEDGSYELIA